MTRLIEDAEKSPFVKFIEEIFQLLTDIQFNCLPPRYRAAGVKKFLETEKSKKMPEMQGLYEKMKEREFAYLKEAGIDSSTLTKQQTSLIDAVRMTVFNTFHDEQDKFIEQYPYEPFMSIWDRQGNINSDNYFVRFHPIYIKAQEILVVKDQELNPPGKEFENFDKYAEQARQELGITATTSDFEAGILCALEAISNIREQDPTDPFKEDANMNAKIITLLQSPHLNTNRVTRDSLVQSWSERAESVRARSKIKLDQQKEKKAREDAAEEIKKISKKYVEAEKKTFQWIYGVGFEKLNNNEKDLAQKVRSVFFRLIHEEQKEIAEQFGHPLPFVSIYDLDGELNEDYWIDLLDARARKNREQPLEGYRHLKSFSDYEVTHVPYVPHNAVEATVDTRGMRQETGGITPAFCRDVLAHMQADSEGIKSRAIAIDKIVASTSDDDQEIIENPQRIYDVIYGMDGFSVEERVRFLQNAFSNSLCQIHYVRGETRGMLEQMNVPYTLQTSPRLLFLNDAGDQETFKEIHALIQQLRNNKSKTKNSEDAVEEDDLIELVSTKIGPYTIFLKGIGRDLETLGAILQSFASGLKKEPENSSKMRRRNTTHAPHSPRGTILTDSSEREKGSGLAKAGSGSTKTTSGISLSKSGSKTPNLQRKSYVESVRPAGIPALKLNAPPSPRLAPNNLRNLTGAQSPRVASPRLGTFAIDSPTQTPRLAPDKFSTISVSLQKANLILQQVSQIIEDDLNSLQN